MNYSNKYIREYLALWSISGIGSVNARKIIAYAGGIEQVFKLKSKDLKQIPGVGNRLLKAFAAEKHFIAADNAMEFSQKFNVAIHSFFDEDYPYRLKQCEDSPLILFTKGKPIETNRKYISIVGTRNATPRGSDFCGKIIKNLKEQGHDVVIVSGLAFGIDIAAHKAAVEQGVSTYGILAHGLDTIYPKIHRDTATKMLDKGGLITEFLPGIFPDKTNFVRRNRIIAGLCDALIVVESDIKGGSLLSADMANSYSRDVFAVPGRLTDKYSLGCNNLIKTNRAALLESVSDIEYILGWDKKEKVIQKQLFVDLKPDEQIIYDLFKDDDELNIDLISRKSNFSMSKVSALLLQMEFAGLIKCLPGKVFARQN